MSDQQTEEAASDPATSEWRPADGARLILSLFLLALGGVYLITALQLPLEQRERPGAGFFPVVAVTLFLVCVIVDLIRLAVARGRGTWQRGAGRFAWPVAAVLASIFAYVALVEVTGHLIVTAFLAAALVMLFGNRPWWQVVIIAVVAGAGTDYLFGELLDVRLSTGLLEIGFAEWI